MRSLYQILLAVLVCTVIPGILSTGVGAVTASTQRLDPTGSQVSSSLSALNVIAHVGITPIQNVYTWGEAAVADYDRDGDNDILLSRHNRDTWQLFAFDSAAHRYREVWKVLRSDKHACVWGDPNRDERLDLFCTVGARQGNGLGPDELWIQNADGSFVNRAKAWGVNDPPGRGRDAAFVDVNNDGWVDLLVGNEYGRSDSLISANRLYINNTNNTFSEKANAYGINRTAGGSCITTADVNSDGFVDLYVCGQVEEWTNKSTVGHLYVNENGLRFLERSSASNLGTTKAADAEFADLDGDGDPDLALALSNNSLQLRRNVDGAFKQTMLTMSTSTQLRDLAVGDVDADGDLDLYALLRGDDFLLINAGGTWTKLSVPRATSGLSDSATMIPNWDGQGRAAIYVGNGQMTVPGPRQFIVVTSSGSQ